MSQIIHMCVNVSGVLREPPEEFAQVWRGVFSDDNGRILSLMEARQYLQEELAKGHRVIPCGPCDNFDYQKGCQGHVVERHR